VHHPCISVRHNRRDVSGLSLFEELGRLPAEMWLAPPVVIIATVVAIGVARHRARLRRYRAIAARTGLAVTSGLVTPVQVHGTYSGRQLLMTIASGRPAGYLRRPWTRVEVAVGNPAQVAMRLRRRDAFDRLFRLGNAPVGDAEFDRRFLVLSQDPGYVMMIFGERPVREAMLRADIQVLRLVGSLLEVLYRREVRTPEHAVLLFDAAVRFADAVDRLRG
jgi:hypothetical protein